MRLTEHSIHFPSQTVSDLEKLSEEYGLKVAKAIKQEWLTGSSSKFNTNLKSFH